MEQKRLRVVIMGAPGSGKTSIISYPISGIYYGQYTPSIGVDIYTSRAISKVSSIEFVTMSCSMVKSQHNQLWQYNSNADLGIVLIPVDHENGIIDSIEYITKFRELNPDKPIMFVHSKCDLEISYNNQYSNDDIYLSLERPETVDNLLKKVCEKLSIPFTKNDSTQARVDGAVRQTGLLLTQLSNELTAEEAEILKLAELAGVRIVK